MIFQWITDDIYHLSLELKWKNSQEVFVYPWFHWNRNDSCVRQGLVVKNISWGLELTSQNGKYWVLWNILLRITRSGNISLLHFVISFLTSQASKAWNEHWVCQWRWPLIVRGFIYLYLILRHIMIVFESLNEWKLVEIWSKRWSWPLARLDLILLIKDE